MAACLLSVAKLNPGIPNFPGMITTRKYGMVLLPSSPAVPGSHGLFVVSNRCRLFLCFLGELHRHFQGRRIKSASLCVKAVNVNLVGFT